MSPQGPPRLATFDYIGLYAYFLTICTFQRTRAFVDQGFGRSAIAKLLQQSEAQRIAVLAYCLMPDHVHFLLRGDALNADLQRFVHRWKQATGYSWKRARGTTLWQRGYFDHVLRDDDDPMRVAKYVVNNPVAADLVRHPADYPLLGSAVYSLDDILSAEEWDPGDRIDDLV